MGLKERIGEDMKGAMKAGDKARVGVLRMLRARLLDAEVASREAQGRDHLLSEAECVDAIASYAKQRRDSIDAFRQAGREDLAGREEAELAVVQEYLPGPLGDDEIRRIVADAVAEAGARSPREMGAVMKLVMPRVKGAADGKKVQALVREALEAAGPR